MSSTLFLLHDPADEKYAQQLTKHLFPYLQIKQVISVLREEEMPVGENQKEQREAAIASADIVVLLISPDFLIEDGLLRQSDCEGHSFPAMAIDYDAVIPFKHRLLETAWNHFRAGARADLRPAYEQFCDEQVHWLEDYALFRALKARHQGASYLEWPAELVRRIVARRIELIGAKKTRRAAERARR